MVVENAFKKPYTVVVAHPDDEALWASSIISGAEKVILCFTKSFVDPEVSKGRIDFPHVAPDNFLFLGLDESVIKSPGLLRISAPLRESEAYAKNSFLIRQHLEREIDTDIVVSHNPWGEYGHPEHIQVHTVVASICKERSKSFYVFGYCSSRTFFARIKDLLRCQITRSLCMSTDMSVFCHLRDHYTRLGCWTWSREYRLPVKEYFLEYSFSSQLVNSCRLPGCYLIGLERLIYGGGGMDYAIPGRLSIRIILLFALELILYMPLRLLHRSMAKIFGSRLGVF